MTTLDCIYIKNFCTPAYIGLYAHEKGATQPIILHLELYGCWQTPDFLDYDLIMNKIKSLLIKQHYELLETLAQTIATTLLAEFVIQKLVLAIDKPQAAPDALVGVKIERTA
jgi:7,8-dihydroneopterin aldolase/epimerase/oxygenase